MIKELHSIEEVISELGGPKAVSELTSAASPSVVPTWKYRKRFPAKKHQVMISALRARGANAPSWLWGMDTPAESETAA